MIDRLRSEGVHPHVVERLLVPMLRGLSVTQLSDPWFVVERIRDDCAEDSDEVLAEAASIAISTRRAFPAANQMGQILAKAREARGTLLRISAQETPAEWVAWIERDREIGRPNKWLRSQGHRHVYRRFPPVGRGPRPAATAEPAEGASARQAPPGGRGNGTAATASPAGRDGGPR